MRYKLKSPTQFALITLIGLLILLTILIPLFDEQQITNVDCYDRFSNKIIGETCEKLEFENQGILDGAMIILIISMFSFGYVSISDAWDYNTNINFFGFEKENTQ